jgi:PKD repeat protein
LKKLENNSNISFDEFIRKNLDNIEFPYDHNSWLELEKDLPKKSFINNNWQKIVAVAGIITAVTLASFYFINNSDKKINTNSNKAGIQHKINISDKLSNTELKINQSNRNNKTDNTFSNLTTNVHSSIKQQTNDAIPVNQNSDDLTSSNNTNKIIDNYSLTKELNSVISPDATFKYSVNEGCSPCEVKFIPFQISDTIIYLWNFGDGKTSANISPSHTFTKSGNYSIGLTITYKKSKQKVTNTINNAINVKQSPTADFDYYSLNNTYNFKNSSLNSNKYKWFFGTESTEEENPENLFTINGVYPIKLIAYNTNGCSDTLSKNINVAIKYNIQIGNAFRPDGVNDSFGPGVADFLRYNYNFIIYNKFDQVVFESNDVNIKWNGRIMNSHQNAEKGKYFWKIFGKDNFGNPYEQKGEVTLLR